MNDQNAKQEPPIKLLPCPVCRQKPEAKPTPFRGIEAVCRTDGCLLNGIWFAIVRWNTQRFPVSTWADAPTDAPGEAGDIVARVLELDAKAVPAPWLPCTTAYQQPGYPFALIRHSDDPKGNDVISAHVRSKEDADLIAFYRTAAPEMARTIATLRAECARLREDKARLDWLEKHTVNVRVPLVHGSRDLFWSSPDDDEGADEPSDIRARIDTASRAGTEGK